MKAVVLLAHPDDCIIFARPFIETHKEFSWTLVYLTYTSTDPRAIEISSYWKNLGIGCIFLGFADNYQDLVTNQISFDTADAAEHIKSQVQDADLILTHNANGEYGHIHHKFVNSVADAIDKPKIYFGDYNQYNKECIVFDSIDLEQLPLHKAVIEQFENINHGRYWLTDSAKELYDQLA
jgi:hypothetical protein